GALAKLGMGLNDLKGLSPEDQFRAIAASLQQVANAGERASIVKELFGRNPEVIRALTADIAGLADEAHRFGLVISEEQVAALDAMGDSLTTVGEEFRSMRDSLGLVIIDLAGGADGVHQLADGVGQLSGAMRENLPEVQALLIGTAALA